MYFLLQFHWSLFLKVQLMMTQHWFRFWLGAEKATSHYLNQCWPDSLTHLCGTRGRGVNCLSVLDSTRSQLTTTDSDSSSWAFSFLNLTTLRFDSVSIHWLHFVLILYQHLMQISELRPNQWCSIFRSIIKYVVSLMHKSTRGTTGYRNSICSLKLDIYIYSCVPIYNIVHKTCSWMSKMINVLYAFAVFVENTLILNSSDMLGWVF